MFLESEPPGPITTSVRLYWRIANGLARPQHISVSLGTGYSAPFNRDLATVERDRAPVGAMPHENPDYLYARHSWALVTARPNATLDLHAA